MRYLHSVQAHEKFIASGVYHLNTAREAWSIHQLPDGAYFVRADWDQLGEFYCLTEAWMNPQFRIERLDVAAEAQHKPIKKIRATYNFLDDHAEIGRTFDNQERRYDELALPSDYVVSTLSELFLGFVVAQLVESPRIMVVPQIYFDDENAFLLNAQEESAVSQANGVIVFRDSTLYLDANHVTLKRESSAGTAQLKDYARRPD